jgi:hypothetical protein
MVAGILFGLALVMVGLVLLAHLSYMNYKTDPSDMVPMDCEAPDMNGNEKIKPPKVNDCPIPLCFFQIASIANHETWIVAFLLGGSAVLSLSLIVEY